MTTEEGLMAAILANPADDLPRLVYADYLEENGEAERAELYRDKSPRVFDTRGLFFRSGDSLSAPSAVELYRMFDEWGVDRWPTGVEFMVRLGGISEVRCTLAEWCGGECQLCHGRGGYENNRYMQWDTCPQCTGEGRTTGIGPSVVRSHPVEVVRVTDREPCRHRIRRKDGEWSYRWAFWVDAETDYEILPVVPPSARIPPELLDHMEAGYQTPAAANAALSAALIAWAKSQPHPAAHRGGNTRGVLR